MFKRIKAKANRKSLQLKLSAIYFKNSLLNDKKQEEKPGVWLELSSDYERYSYILSKFFELEGYQVYFKADLMFVVKLTNQYSSKLITEGRVKFSNEKPAGLATAFSDRSSGDDLKSISNDYFGDIFEPNKNSYYIPIGMHPNMYTTGLWNAPVDLTQRKQSAFFAGNFKEALYQEFSENEKFKMPDRVELKKVLESLPNATFPKSYTELAENRKPGQIDIVSLNNFRVPQETLRQTIAGYSFFIACPGCIMPQSHNVYEAMSVGTIPIIHRDYARMFHPELEDNKTAIVYDEDFIEKLQQALQIEPEQLEFMHTQVGDYYKNHLTPHAIVRQLLDPKKTNYFLNAEKNSVLVMK